MAQDYDYEVNDGGGKTIVNTFYDEAGDPVTPTSVTWSLYDGETKVVNSRLDVSETPSTSNDVVLSGPDFTITTGQTEERVLVVKIVYDSSKGSGLTQTKFTWIKVKYPHTERVSA